VVPPCIAFYDRLARTMCLCLVALSCSRCDVDVVNLTLQIRRIGRRSAVALSSPMRPITADAPVSDVRHQHRSYTNRKFHLLLNKCIFNSDKSTFQADTLVGKSDFIIATDMSFCHFIGTDVWVSQPTKN